MIDNDLPRLSRLIAIFTALQSRRIMTAPRMAEKFGVSVRTIYRDLRALEAAGVPIRVEEGKGYSLVEGYRMPPVMFTENEALALITAEAVIKSSRDDSLTREFSSAIEKIRAILSYTNKARIEHLESRMGVGKALFGNPMSSYLISLQQSLLDFRVVEIDYENNSGELSTRKVEPFAIYNSMQEYWIVAGYCRLRQDFRSFRLDRIRAMRVMNETFERHDITVEEFLKRSRSDEQP